MKLVLCGEIGSLWSLDAPEFHESVTSENQFHCTRLCNALAWIVDMVDRTQQDVPADAGKVLVCNDTTRQQVLSVALDLLYCPHGGRVKTPKHVLQLTLIDTGCFV